MNWLLELEDLVLFGVRVPPPEVDRLLPDDAHRREAPGQNRKVAPIRWGFARAVNLSARRLPFSVTPGYVGWTALPVFHSEGPGYHLSNLYLTGVAATFAAWLTRLPVRSRPLHLPRRPHSGGRYQWCLGETSSSYVRARLVDSRGGPAAGDVLFPEGRTWDGVSRPVSYGGRRPALEARISTGDDSRVRSLRVEEFELTNLAGDLQRHHPPDLEDRGVYLSRLTVEIGGR